MAKTIAVGEKIIALDGEGYLKRLDDWSPQVAEVLARHVGLELTEAHWEVINIIRDFHARRGLSPITRIMVRLLEKECGPEKGNTLYLLRLFPGRPSHLAAKIAGLPRPSNCL